jgi:hypothetical protein
MKYFLACNNDTGDILNGRVEEMESKEVKERGKNNKQTSRKKQNNETKKSFKDINRER